MLGFSRKSRKILQCKGSAQLHKAYFTAGNHKRQNNRQSSVKHKDDNAEGLHVRGPSDTSSQTLEQDTSKQRDLDSKDGSRNFQHKSYRSYQPYTPVNSRLLKKRWDQYSYDIHRRKVLSAKKNINNCAPKIFPHIVVNVKKQQNVAYRSAEIVRHNKMLLNKMDTIRSKGGRTDNRNNYTSKSLNAAKRRRELVQIAHENREILKRLNVREPNYDHKKLQLDWKENCQLLWNISHFPPPGHLYYTRARSESKSPGRRPE